MSPREEAERVTAAANALIRCFEHDGAEIAARALIVLASVLVERDPEAKTVLAAEMLKLARQMEPKMPFARLWN